MEDDNDLSDICDIGAEPAVSVDQFEELETSVGQMKSDIGRLTEEIAALVRLQSRNMSSGQSTPIAGAQSTPMSAGAQFTHASAGAQSTLAALAFSGAQSTSSSISAGAQPTLTSLVPAGAAQSSDTSLSTDEQALSGLVEQVAFETAGTSPLTSISSPPRQS